MTSTERTVVGSCDELASGDAIEAFSRNTLVHCGPVTNTVPERGLFWILDTVTGSRRLVDMSELTVVRVSARYREVRVAAARP